MRKIFSEKWTVFKEIFLVVGNFSFTIKQEKKVDFGTPTWKRMGVCISGFGSSFLLGKSFEKMMSTGVD